MQEDIIWEKAAVGRVNLRKTTPMRASSKRFKKQIMTVVSINLIIMWAIIKSSTWSLKTVQLQHLACVGLHVNRLEWYKSWEQKVKSVGIWRKIAFPSMTF